MNILLYDENEFYKQGLRTLLIKMNNDMNIPPPHFIDLAPQKNNASNINMAKAFLTADIIFNAVDIYNIKFPRTHLKRMKPSALLINITSKGRTPSFLFDCVKDAIFIDRKASCKSISSLCLSPSTRRKNKVCTKQKEDCQACLQGQLTTQQFRIISYMFAGYSPVEISSAMNIQYKTLCSHKRIIMNKFNLKSDLELSDFLNNYFRTMNK